MVKYTVILLITSLGMLERELVPILVQRTLEVGRDHLAMYRWLNLQEHKWQNS